MWEKVRGEGGELLREEHNGVFSRRGNAQLVGEQPRNCRQRLNGSKIIYGHRNMKARLPVRSALVKHVIARLVLQWVTMRESLVP